MLQGNIDTDEIKKFSKLSSHWWDPKGDLRTLHYINPIRLHYITNKINPSGKTALDIGCGGGLMTESLASLAATVTGIDMSQEALSVAKLHQHESGTSAEYILMTAENFAEVRPNQYDIVTCLEMLEHVPDPASVVKAAATLTKSGGHLFFSTLNRNIKSYLFAILGAEYLLKLLPKNTHDYAKFIKPSELAEWARQSHLTVKEMVGITYHPLTKTFQLSQDCSVNYIVYCQKK